MKLVTKTDLPTKGSSGQNVTKTGLPTKGSSGQLNEYTCLVYAGNCLLRGNKRKIRGNRIEAYKLTSF